VLGTVAVIVASGAGLPKSTAWIVNARPVQTMGDISYSLYLWHWPVLMFAPYITGVPSESWFMMILLSFALALAWLTTKLVENPIRRTPLAAPEFHERRVGLTRVGVVSLLLTVGLSGIGASVQATRTDNLAGECRGVMASGATNATSVGQADCERSTPLDRERR
ncbi:MAG: acyltransferase, partial [Salinibacterium sp.]|nr:acyltransferase [Salinibacterium sp.]